MVDEAPGTDDRAASDADTGADDDVLSEPGTGLDDDFREAIDSLVLDGTRWIVECVRVVGDVDVAGEQHARFDHDAFCC